jgi:diacylglycerol kinase (ATP)
MAALDHFVLIYNPDSTGNSPKLARQFAEEIKRQLPAADVDLLQTKRAGHAEDLAYAAAQRSKDIVLISVSGDGGYNEVVNGAARAADDHGASPICAVLPGGNANDHYSSVYHRPLMEAILDGEPKPLDLLKVEAAGTMRYAHSYVGLGLSPLVAAELNKRSLNRFKESLIVLNAFGRLKPFEIEVKGRLLEFDSMVFANIPRMAKYLRLSKDASIDDGKFEIVMLPHAGIPRLLLNLMGLALGRIKRDLPARDFTFTTVRDTPIQLDGEVIEVASGVSVRVATEHSKVRTIR